MRKGKILAIDYGTRRIGLASGDFESRIAFPRDVVGNNPAALEKILKLCEELNVAVVVIGLPLSMEERHAENPLMAEVKNFAEKIRAAGFEIDFIDERLSTFEAGRLAKQGGHLDAYAAQIILQRFFDGLV